MLGRRLCVCVCVCLGVCVCVCVWGGVGGGVGEIRGERGLNKLNQEKLFKYCNTVTCG